MNSYDAVRLYNSAGLNVIPVKTDGSKQPKIRWQQFQTQKINIEHYSYFWVSEKAAIGIVCGITSGNLEVFDDDGDLFSDWFAIVDKQCPEMMRGLPIVATPSGGHHIYYRCETIAQNTILAQEADGGMIFETRGQGGMAVGVGSPLSTHPSGRPYKLIQGDLFNVPTISTKERETMWNAARTFNRFVPKPKPILKLDQSPTYCELFGEESAERPGDRFNRLGRWEDALSGWTLVRTSGEVGYWQKPGCSGGEGHHATTGYCGDNFYVFSTNCPPFDSGRKYNKFATLALNCCGGDFKEAARYSIKLLEKI